MSATVGHAERSSNLREFIEGGKKIIISTVQKFPVILNEMSGDFSDRNFAIIIDEAHSSQGGRTAAAMSGVLSSGDAEEDEDTFEDQINRIIESKRMLANASYFAFTATPKNRTLELFGEPDPQPDGTKKHLPFHSYTMKQAIVVLDRHRRRGGDRIDRVARAGHKRDRHDAPVPGYLVVLRCDGKIDRCRARREYRLRRRCPRKYRAVLAHAHRHRQRRRRVARARKGEGCRRAFRHRAGARTHRHRRLRTGDRCLRPARQLLAVGRAHRPRHIAGTVCRHRHRHRIVRRRCHRHGPQVPPPVDPAQVRHRPAGHLEDVVAHPAKTIRHVRAELDLQRERRAPVMCLRHRRERRRQPWRRRRHRIRGRRRRAFARRVHRAHPERVVLAVGEARHLLRRRRPARGIPRLRAFLLVLVGRDRLRRDLRRRNPLQARPAIPRLRVDTPRRPGQLTPGRHLQPHRHHLPVRQAHTVRARLPPVGVLAHGRRPAAVHTWS